MEIKFSFPPPFIKQQSKRKRDKGRHGSPLLLLVCLCFVIGVGCCSVYFAAHEDMHKESWMSFLCFQVAEEISKVKGVKKVLVAQHDSYKGGLPGIVGASFLNICQSLSDVVINLHRE